jgi:hypothetical protein
VLDRIGRNRPRKPKAPRQDEQAAGNGRVDARRDYARPLDLDQAIPF